MTRKEKRLAAETKRNEIKAQLCSLFRNELKKGTNEAVHALTEKIADLKKQNPQQSSFYEEVLTQVVRETAEEFGEIDKKELQILNLMVQLLVASSL